MKLNCDMGESFGLWKMGRDEEIMPYIDMANIACGFHASDPHNMTQTVALAKKNNVSIGAHPSYPDLLGFGRRDMAFSNPEISSFVVYQVGALQSICHAQGTRVDYIKPHGALYNAMMRDISVFSAIVEAISSLQNELPLVVLASNQADQMQGVADRNGVTLVHEVFCDRAYQDDGSLVARTKKHSVLEDDAEIEIRINELIGEQQLTTISGKKISINADTICVHGDHTNAVESIRKIRKYIDRI